MLLAGVSGLSIAIMADFWQPEKNEKSGIDQILTPACCPRQYKHIDIKNVAYNHVTAILELCKKAKKCCSASSSSSHFLFSRDFSGTIADTDTVNTPLEPLRAANVPFGGHVTETKDWDEFLPTNRFFG